MVPPHMNHSKSTCNTPHCCTVVQSCAAVACSLQEAMLPIRDSVQATDYCLVAWWLSLKKGTKQLDSEARAVPRFPLQTYHNSLKKNENTRDIIVRFC